MARVEKELMVVMALLERTGTVEWGALSDLEKISRRGLIYSAHRTWAALDRSMKQLVRRELGAHYVEPRPLSGPRPADASREPSSGATPWTCERCGFRPADGFPCPFCAPTAAATPDPLQDRAVPHGEHDQGDGQPVQPQHRH